MITFQTTDYSRERKVRAGVKGSTEGLCDLDWKPLKHFSITNLIGYKSLYSSRNIGLDSLVLDLGSQFARCSSTKLCQFCH